MAIFNRLSLILLTSCAGAALSACDGASSIASPGGGTININNPPAPTPTPTPMTPTPTGVQPAASCPSTIAGITDTGTITGPTGTYRVCTLPARVTQDTTLVRIPGVLYRLGGRVDVGTDGGPTASAADSDVTLTIEPGTIIFAGSGTAWLGVNRGNRINAVGTPDLPIIFTSQQNVQGNVTVDSSGQWGGVVLMGRAPITDCLVSGAAPGTVDCERQTEGAADPARYGGATSDDNSGRLSYVQIRYSGYALLPDNELQSLTTEGIGSTTQIDHIMSYNSSDDGAEFFGGLVNLKYFISVGAEDDNLDSDTGVQGNFQYVLAIQRPGIGDTMIEADSDNSAINNLPRQHTQLSNFTFIQRSNIGGDAAAMLIRGGADYSMANGVVVSPNYACLRFSSAQTIQAANNGQQDKGAPMFNSVQMQCANPAFVAGTDVTANQVQNFFNMGTNVSSTYVPTLTSLYINGATEETGVTPYNVNTNFGSFFNNTPYIGAVNTAATWYQRWTCNSATADFGTGNSGDCASLPTY